MNKLGIVQIDDKLRLVPIDLANIEVALEWYQDKELLLLVDGPNRAKPYDYELLQSMYTYLANIGFLFWIEVLHQDNWLKIGDATLAKTTLPIVIGNKSYQGQGIGKKVIKRFIQMAQELNWDKLYVKEIYPFNKRSQNLFLSLGFTPYRQTEQGTSYILKLS